MRIDPAGLPFVGAALVLAALAAAGFGWVAAIPCLVLAAFFLFFFRDPDRRVEVADDAVLSPADGRVLVAGGPVSVGAPPGEWRQISIFLSPWDVHVNRIPVSGRVAQVSHTPGRFLPAYRHDAGSVNERIEIWIERRGVAIVVRQVVGILARRIVCRLEPGATVHAGDRYGIMKFGSRMDVFLPPEAEIRVGVGEIVRGGETVIAVLHSTHTTGRGPRPLASGRDG